MSLLQLKPALHRFDKSRFNDISELQRTSPTRDGWVAMMMTCSELGFAPDSNSLFKPGQLFIVQNFGNVVLPNSCVTAGETRCVIAATEREIQHIIVCGHLSCRTVGHFLEKGSRSVIWLENGAEPVTARLQSPPGDVLWHVQIRRRGWERPTPGG